MDRNLNHSSDDKLVRDDNKNQWGYEPYHWRDTKMTFHLAPHSHDDVGWLKTVDEYYSGVYQPNQRVQVMLILDSVIPELMKDENKRFCYVEMKFFEMWWRDQSDQMKEDVRGLVKSGRLEILNAGWSMHDEACPHYEDMINNMQIGHEFALKELGVAPSIGWQIDPFGHSTANARLMAEMGFDAFFFARLDYQDKDRRLADKEMDWIWRPMYEELGEDAQIFTHALYNHYSAPPGFDFDTLPGMDDSIVVDERLTSFNADRRASEFYDHIYHQLQHYKSEKHAFHTMGDDFHF
jgi:hypothetical protein